MNDRCRLSVIVPGYDNRPEWWKRCLDSVRAACGQDDEIICVDDGSTVPVEAAWVGAGEDARVRLLRKPNGGLSSARNFGMEAARGRYWTFVDSDDAVRREAFDRCVSSLEATGADIAVYGVEVRWPYEGLEKADVPPARNYGRLTPDDVLALRRALVLNYAWNKVYRADFLSAGGSGRTGRIVFNPRGMPCEDIIFNLDCIVAGARWVGVDFPGYVYYHRTRGSLLSSYKPSNLDGTMAAADAWKRYAATLDEGDRCRFDSLANPPRRKLLAEEWKNLWMRGSPYSLAARWRWLKAHGELGGLSTFAKTAFFFFVRRHFYFRAVRRWHLKKMHPNAKAARCVNTSLPHE